jgi:hypothetical protein
MRKSIYATLVTAVVVFMPATGHAHGGEEPLSDETTATILDANSGNSALGPALIGGGLAAGAAAVFMLLRRRPAIPAVEESAATDENTGAANPDSPSRPEN